MKISVIIPTYNRCESLERTLHAIRTQTLPAEHFELVIVSDGSNDGTDEMVANWAPHQQIVYLRQNNSGPSVARNLGISCAHGELLVFLDDDIEPCPTFLQSHFEAHILDDRLVIIGPQSPPPNERFPVWIDWEHRMLERQYANFRSGVWSVGPNNLYSGNFSVRRQYMLDCGGFDPKFKRQEDVELGFRLEKLGLRFAFCPEAIGYHRPVRSFDSWLKSPYLYGIRDVQMARDKGENTSMDLARKHYNQRNALTKLLARSCIGVPLAEKGLFQFLKYNILFWDRMGLRNVSLGVCSILFNLLYLQGMAQEIGGSKKMWNELSVSRKNNTGNIVQ
jgi:glycosyltransferase involved in cell wall biosynthesis